MTVTKKKPDQSGPTVTGKELAKHMGITRRQLEYLTRMGIVTNLETVQGKPSKYDITAAVQSYCRYLEAKQPAETEKTLELEKLAAEVQYKQAKAAKAQKEVKDLENQYLRASDVKVFTADLIGFIQKEIISLPSKVSEEIAVCHDAQTITGILEREAVRILHEVADHRYDPDEYAAETATHKPKRKANEKI